MVTSIPTGEYIDNATAATVILSIFPLMMILLGNIGNNIVDIANEKNEEKLLNILKRIGYRPVVDLYQDAIITGLSTLVFFVPAAIVLVIIVFPSVNLALAILFFIIVAFEMFVINSILNYGFTGAARVVLFLAFYGIQLIVLIASSTSPVISPMKIYTFSLFPMTQVGAFGIIALQAQNIEVNLDWSNMNEPIVLGIPMLHLILITIACTVLAMLIFAYIIPLTIAADPENPLKWYYPCVCGRGGKQSVEE